MRAAFSAPDDLFLRQRQPGLEQARQRFDFGRDEPTKHIEARDKVFGSQAEIEPDAFARALSFGSVFAFERAVELAADDAVLRQLPDQRYFERQAGLGKEMPLEPLRRLRAAVRFLSQALLRQDGCGKGRTRGRRLLLR